jgi:hypothetical protein
MLQFKRNLKYVIKITGHKKIRYYNTQYQKTIILENYNKLKPSKEKKIRKIVYYYCLECKYHVAVCKWIRSVKTASGGISIWHWQDYINKNINTLPKRMLTCNEIVIKNIIE